MILGEFASSNVGVPLTSTVWTPRASCHGSSKVDVSAIEWGSSTTMSAAAPTVNEPRSVMPIRDAGNVVILRIASSSEMVGCSRT